MFKRVKNWLGIEGVKLELVTPEKIREEEKKVSGKLRFKSLNDQFVREVKIRLIETYSRGRKKKKLVDEYTLGEILLNEEWEVKKNQIIEIDFELPFVHAKSEMDLLEAKNFITGGIVKLAKKLRAVKSTFRIVAEAKVKGTKFHPFDTKPVKLL